MDRGIHRKDLAQADYSFLFLETQQRPLGTRTTVTQRIAAGHAYRKRPDGDGKNERSIG